MIKIAKLFEETIIETNNFRVAQDWGIPIPGFFILSSIREIKSVAGFNEDEAQEFIKLAAKVRKGMKEVLGINDVYLFQRENTKYSFHFWLFPRFGWMEKFGEKIDSVQKIIDYAKENMINDKAAKEVKEYAEKMREYMKSF